MKQNKTREREGRGEQHKDTFLAAERLLQGKYSAFSSAAIIASQD